MLLKHQTVHWVNFTNKQHTFKLPQNQQPFKLKSREVKLSNGKSQRFPIIMSLLLQHSTAHKLQAFGKFRDKIVSNSFSIISTRQFVAVFYILIQLINNYKQIIYKYQPL